MWSIGLIIFILMIGTAFLGYSNSPKWFNQKNTEYKINKLNNKLKKSSSIPFFYNNNI